jgi:hypothetical protein
MLSGGLARVCENKRTRPAGKEPSRTASPFIQQLLPTFPSVCSSPVYRWSRLLPLSRFRARSPLILWKVRWYQKPPPLTPAVHVPPHSCGRKCVSPSLQAPSLP